LRQLLNQGNREDAERLAHTLKGLAGNIGANDLQHAMSALEASLRPEHEAINLSALLDRAEYEHQIIISGIGQALGLSPLATNSPSSQSPDLNASARSSAPLQKAAQAMADVLSQDSVEAFDTFTQHQQNLQLLLGERLQAFQAALSDFNFGEALRVLALARAELDKA